MFRFSLLVLPLFFLVSCEKNGFVPTDDTLYFESFEESLSAEDQGMVSRQEDAPDGGGSFSLQVSGGCLVPHYEVEIGPFENDYTVRLQLWGKVVDRGGGAIYLRNEDGSESIQIAIEGEEWQAYQSDETLEVAVGERLTLGYLSGGIVSITTLYDAVEIVAVD